MTVSTSKSSARLIDVVAGEELYDDDGNAIGTREFCVTEGLPASATDRLTRVFAVLTPEEIGEIIVNRVVIEQAKGVLMFIYDIDADDAFELLKWRSQAADVKLRILAKQLTEGLGGTPPHTRAALQAACDDLLFTGHEGI